MDYSEIFANRKHTKSDNAKDKSNNIIRARDTSK